MNKKKIIILSVSFLIVAIGFLLRKLGVTWFVYLLLFILFLLSGPVIIPFLAKDAKKAKKAFDLYGGLIAFVALHLIVYLWLPKYFGYISETPAFWAFEALFILVNCAFLGHTWFTIFSVKLAAIILVFCSLVAMSAPVFKDSSRIVARIEKYALEAPIINAINKTKVRDYDNTVEPLLEEGKKLRKKAESGNFSEQDRENLKALEANLSKIQEETYPELGTQFKKEEQRILSGFFRLVPGKIVSLTTEGKELPNKEGERGKFIQISPPGKVWVVNQNIPSYSFTEEEHITRPAISDGKIQLQMDGNKGEILIYAQIVP